MQFDFFPPQSDWKLPTEFPELGPVFAIDTETKDPLLTKKGPSFIAPGTGFIAGFSVSNDKYSAYYPVRHEQGGNIPLGKAFRWLQTQLDKAERIIFANAFYDIGWLLEEGLEIDFNKVHDVQIMAPLIDENKYSYSLDKLGKEYLGMGKDEDLLKRVGRQFGFKKDSQIKANMWRFPVQYVGPYAEEDAVITYKLYEHFLVEIKDQELERVYELERKLIPTLLKMRKQGIRVDLDKAHELRKRFVSREKEAILKLNKLAGLRIDPYSPRSCGILFDKLGIEYARTANGQPSVTAPFLQTLDHEAGQLIRDARRFQKAHSTFLDGYIFGYELNGRVHPQFNQLKSDEGGTVSGRFSSSNFNLQNIPARDPEVGPFIREVFLPEEGEQWMAADYANQEPRITVHYAHMCKMDKAQVVVDRYKEDPYLSYHKIIQEMIQEFIPSHLNAYKTAKAINLGLAYGMGGPKLCKQIGLPTEMVESWKGDGEMIEVAGPDGRRILDQYNKEVPYIKELADLSSRRAKYNGHITTLGGRRCHFPDGKGSHKALNRLIQGTAADQTKIAMVKMSEHKDLNMIMTMHDEIGLSIQDLDQARKAKQIMEDAIPMAVPFVCDIDIGPSWGGAKEVKL